MADRVRSLDISGPRLRSCNSNSCMKLSFEEREMSIHVCERIAFPASPDCHRRRNPQNGLRVTGRGRTVRPNEFEKPRARGAPHELRYVRKAKGMAEPRAGVHEDACPPRGSDLRQAGCGGPALEGDPDPRGTEEEGEGRRPLEHVHAAERA